jgi:hypothetical protein
MLWFYRNVDGFNIDIGLTQKKRSLSQSHSVLHCTEVQNKWNVHKVAKHWTQRNWIYKERTRHVYKSEVLEESAFKLKIVFVKEIYHGLKEKRQGDR